MTQRTVLDEQTGSIEFEPRSNNVTAPSGDHGMSGRAALADALRDVKFPAKREELLRSIGDRVVEFRRGQPIHMKDALERSQMNEYSSLLDAARELHRVLDERHRERREEPPPGR
ncbi:MAG TPA: hypothetical protein VGL13_17440 [Polyangiaceae bacterium]